jgi:hypothetical protein
VIRRRGQGEELREFLRVGYCWKVSKSRKNPFDQIESSGENRKREDWDAIAFGEGRTKLNEFKIGETSRVISL